MRREFGMPYPEMKEPRPERLRQSFEYRDREGRLIGRAEVELDADEKEIPANEKEGDAAVRGRVLRKFVLHGEKDGSPTSIDMLALAEAGDTEVVVASEREDNYQFYENDNRAAVPPLETPVDVATFLHELGHGKQHREAPFAGLEHFYRLEKKLDTSGNIDLEKLRSLVEHVREIVSEAAHLLTDKHLDEIAEIEGERIQKERDHLTLLGASVKEAGRKTAEGRAEELQRRADETKAEAEALAAELKETMVALRVRDFIALPTSILERDATRRALQWARKVRAEANVDLFARHVAPPEPSEPKRDSDCERSVAEGMTTGDERPERETDIVEELKRWLDTYDADRLRMRNPDDPNDVGITPTVARRRQKK